jgi:signal transduction histidine kinase
MDQLTDQQLIDELQERLKSSRKALTALGILNGKLEQMNRRLQESEALKGQFLSNIRNEMTNPLSSIMGFSNCLINGQADLQRNAGIARMIYAEAFYLDFQLQNIFIAAELEAGEASPALARVDVTGVIGSILDLLDHMIQAKGIAIKAKGPASLSFVTDAQKLHQIVINFLTNAIEFSPEEGMVEIEALLEGGNLRLSVRDHGIGIDTALHEMVFDRFRQLDSGSTKKHPGHGLGLSVTKALAELLGGRVTIASAPGQGCKLSLWLPEPEVEGIDVLAHEGNLFLFEKSQIF